MTPFLPVTIIGESNTQLSGVAAVIRSAPQRVSPVLTPRICYMPKSVKGSEDIVFVSAVPKVEKREVAGQGGAIGTLKKTITVDSYEVSLEIPGDDYDDDQIGAYSPLAADLAMALQLAPDELVTNNLVEYGTTGTAYDSVAFYATTHKWPGGKSTTSNDNLGTGTGTDEDDVENDYWSAYQRAAAWLDDRDRLKNPPQLLQNPADIIVHYPVNLAKVMDRVFGKTAGGDAFELYHDTGATTDTVSTVKKSTLAGKATLQMDGYLASNDWYIHFVGGGEADKPFVFLNRQPASVVVLSKGSEHFAKHGTILIKGTMRFGLGYNKPERSQKINN